MAKNPTHEASGIFTLNSLPLDMTFEFTQEQSQVGLLPCRLWAARAQ